MALSKHSFCHPSRIVGPYLVDEDVSQLVDDEILVAVRSQRIFAPFQQLDEEADVNVAELVHAWEHLLHQGRVHLQVLHQPLPEDVGHDLQRSDVVDLGLDELCEDETSFSPKLHTFFTQDSTGKKMDESWVKLPIHRPPYACLNSQCSP